MDEFLLFIYASHSAFELNNLRKKKIVNFLFAPINFKFVFTQIFLFYHSRNLYASLIAQSISLAIYLKQRQTLQLTYGLLFHALFELFLFLKQLIFVNDFRWVSILFILHDFLLLLQRGIILPTWWSSLIQEEYFYSQKGKFSLEEIQKFNEHAAEAFANQNPKESIKTFGKFKYFEFPGIKTENKSNISANISSKKVKGVPEWLVPFVKKLCKVVPEQKFNTVFVQQYKVGSYIDEHRDPANVLGVSVIGVFGDNFEGGKLFVEEELASDSAGDVVILRSKIHKLPMPLHTLTKITSGERISLILSTVYFPTFPKRKIEWTESKQYS